MKPPGYPLPWCEALDVPYYRINRAWSFSRDGWRAWQSGKPMAEINPEIDRLLAVGAPSFLIAEDYA